MAAANINNEDRCDCACTGHVCDTRFQSFKRFLQVLLGVSALLAVPEYRRAVLEGLVASIGGLDASLCKEASAAFVQTLTAADPGRLTAPLASCTARPQSSDSVS